MIEHELEKIGLTRGEIKVYLALLGLGTSTAGPITTKSRISPSKIYDVLNRLIVKGLVSYVIKGKIRHYKAASPTRILEYVRQKEATLAIQREKIRGLIPTLEVKYKLAGTQQVAEIFHGISGIKTFFEMSLEECRKNDTIYLLGYPKLASKIFHEYNKNFHTRRVQKNVHMKALFNRETWFWKKREKRKFIEQRYLSKSVITPAFIMFFNDITGNIIVTETQKLCILIKNKSVAESYKEYFAMLWKQAIKTKK
jgi:HTH-type transcriptional regulator, sugar sensing transcriptional regulator